ncbi:MAG: cell division protein FtsQ/DivIB [Candidatus Pseudobacter hemicellulosilyticus]|uniref:Cell division protein FtsQ/DivIB n=1 Tax=Candidatus Pseudobacter hemicellulosilyticus TaxID=3121375 RepID=A0AAJ6BIX2_9BACT|nr:MAG: cell division protein FtsQ/DivIB [Pseudobacter sp.]
MKKKTHIRRMLTAGFWCLIGTGVLVLLVAAIRSRNNTSCQGYEIEILGGGDQWFMDKAAIVQVLTANGSKRLKGRPMQEFDLRQLEEKLERNVWVKDAQLYFDNKQVLNVKIMEREPVARVFTASGNSFYIDSSGARLPLSDKLSARLPVFTSFPADKPRKADSALLGQMKQLTAFLSRQPFWAAQVAQIDITPAKKFELVPVVGDHIIDFGDGKDCEKKFARLLTFYKQVLSKTGFNAYDRINVQFDRQVIGVRKPAALSKFDSAQAEQRLELLIADARQVVKQTAPRPDTLNTEKPPIAPKPVPSGTTNSPRLNPPLKSRSYETPSNPVKSQPPKPPPGTPKAVMPKRSTANN